MMISTNIHVRADSEIRVRHVASGLGGEYSVVCIGDPGACACEATLFLDAAQLDRLLSVLQASLSDCATQPIVELRGGA
jgi:hypothetical protein